jgi:hypothetical protein
MTCSLRNRKTLFIAATIVIILLNFYTFAVAYPTMKGPLNLSSQNQVTPAVAIPTVRVPLNLTGADISPFSMFIANSGVKSAINLASAEVPRDFSVYYIAAWRLLHNPSKIFATGALRDGEPKIVPYLTPYKYLPSFLLLISPLTSLSYYQAFWLFDAVQFALLPAIAFLLYKLLEKKNPAIALLIFVAVLLLPYPMTGRGLSVSYFMQWAEGQAKVMLTFLLLASFYLGYRGRPVVSGIVFAIGAFDVRFTIFALPLFLYYNKDKPRESIGAAALAFACSNLMILYSGMAQGFFNMLLTQGGSTPFYTPAYIPLMMIGCLSLVNANQMIDALFEAPAKLGLGKIKNLGR